MADTNTPNILLLLPDLGDTFNFALHVENNFSTIDSLMGAVQCTTTTRPSNTYAGQIIYETDSKRYVQNTGTKGSPVWTYMSHAALVVTSATRPTSGLASGGLIYETDTGALVARNGSNWDYLTNASCTSSSRPSSASVGAGASIWETDTARYRVYDGAGWNFVAGKTPNLKVHNSAAANNNIANTSITAMVWNTEDWKTDSGLHSTGSNTDRIVPTEQGLWRFEYAIAWTNNTTGERESFIDINNAGSKFAWQSLTTAGGAFAMNGGYTARMNGTTDFAQCKVFQNSGGSLTCGGDANTYFAATYLGKF